MEAADGLNPIVRVRDLRLRRGSRVVLDGVSFDAARGRILTLMGASGSGKTTMLRAIAALEPFERGQIDVDGAVLPPGAPAASAVKAVRAQIGMVFQFHCLFEHLTAMGNVALAPVHVRGASPDAARARAVELLRQLGVERRAEALPRELSGGEAQRVAIARALATDPPVLLMDEPTASLDAGRRLELAAILRDLVRRGRTLIVATHDEAFAGAVDGRAIRLEQGRLTAG
jgi:ABC-type polar amino acid transport system ATPase subunit